jgi:hypothetical protein
METALGTLSTEEFEELFERAIDGRLDAWLAQVMDVLIGPQDEENADLRSELAGFLRRSLEQARLRQDVDVQTFEEQIER